MKKILYLFFIFILSINLSFAITPSNTKITAQTSLSYETKSGDIVLSLSNQVTVILNEIVSFSVDNYLPELNLHHTHNVEFPYRISNYGNNLDSYIIGFNNYEIFDSFDVFIDKNKNGVIDLDEQIPLQSIGDSFFHTPLVKPNENLFFIFRGILKDRLYSNTLVLDGTVQSVTKKSVIKKIKNVISIESQGKVKVRKAIFYEPNENQYYFTFKFSNEFVDNLEILELEDNIDSNFKINSYTGFWKSFGSNERKIITFFSDKTEKVDSNIMISLINNMLKVKLTNIPRHLQTDTGGTLYIPFNVDSTLSKNTILQNIAKFRYIHNNTQSDDFSTNNVFYFLEYKAKAFVTGDSNPTDISNDEKYIYEFKNTITNLGNDSDIYNILPKNSTFPGKIQFLNLTDSNNDGILDSGLLKPGEKKQIIFQIVINSTDILNKKYSVNNIFKSIKDETYIISNGNILNLLTDFKNIEFIKSQGIKKGIYTKKDIEVKSGMKIYYKIILTNKNSKIPVVLDKIYDTIPENTVLSNGNGSIGEGGKPVFKIENQPFKEIKYFQNTNMLMIENIIINPMESVTIFFNVEVI